MITSHNEVGNQSFSFTALLNFDRTALATNPVDVQLRTVFEQTIKNKHIENKKSCILLAKHYPSGTITDIIEEHMFNNKTSLDESIQMIVDDILNNER